MPDTPSKKKDLGLDGELKKRRRKNKIVVYFTSKQVSEPFENGPKNILGIRCCCSQEKDACATMPVPPGVGLEPH